MDIEKLKQAKSPTINWEKVGVYGALVAAFFSMMSWLFGIKDDITNIRERTTSNEKDIKYLNEKMEKQSWH